MQNEITFHTEYNDERETWIGCIVFSDNAGDESDDLEFDTREELIEALESLAEEYANADTGENFDRIFDGNDWQRFMGDCDPDDFAGDVEDNVRATIEALYTSDFDADQIAAIVKGLAGYASAELEAAAAETELNAVMTVAEIATEYGLTERGIRATIRRGSLPARQSGKTWLVRRVDAEARWGA